MTKCASIAQVLIKRTNKTTRTYCEWHRSKFFVSSPFKHYLGLYCCGPISLEYLFRSFLAISLSLLVAAESSLFISKNVHIERAYENCKWKVANVTHFTYHSMYVCEAGCCKYAINWSLYVRPWSACVRVHACVCVRLLRLVKMRVSVVYVEAIVCTKFIPKPMHPTSIAISCLICNNKNVCSIYINWSFFYRWARISKW